MEPLRLARRSALVLPFAALLLAGPAALVAQDAPPDLPRPCEDDPLRDQLDFWLGEWRVMGSDGQELGTSRIRSRDGGCVIEEVWTSARGGGSGLGLNFVDPEDGRWRQVWVGSTGTVVRYEGAFEGGVMRFRGRTTMADGGVTLSRAVLEPLGEAGGGRVRQTIERSTDGGTTWSRYFEGTYVPANGLFPAVAPRPEPEPAMEAEPVAPETTPSHGRRPAPASDPLRNTEPAPAPSPQPSQVTAVSGEVADEDIPVGERPKRRLQSPMVLEVPVGAVEAIPEGYAWSTDETAQYIVEEAVVRRVAMTRDTKRRGVELTVTATLHSSRFLNHGDLDVELLHGGETIASGRVDDFAIGRSLPAQGDGPGLERRVTMTVDEGTFDRIFGGEERPVLRLTLTIRD